MIGLTTLFLQSSSTNTLEVELVLHCSQTSIPPARQTQIRTLVQQQDINWKKLMEIAVIQGVTPMVYQSLNSICAADIPEDIYSELQNRSNDNAWRNLFLTAELHKLLKLFKQEDIPAIPYKGAIMAVSAYGNLALREFFDLDILVSESDVSKVNDLLSSQGYQGSAQYSWYSREQTFVNQKNQINVDLHWGLFPGYLPPFEFNFEQLWQRCQLYSIGSTQQKSFSWEDLLVILAIQIFKDAFNGSLQLLKICDLNQVISSGQSWDWQQIIQQNQGWEQGKETPVLFALCLTQQLFGTKLSPEIKQRIKISPLIGFSANRIRQQIFARNDIEKTVHNLIARLFFVLLMKKAFSLRFLLGQLIRLIIEPNQGDKEFVWLPKYLEFLYYFVRPMRKLSQFVIKIRS
jgi:hypothetical protein